MPLRRLNYQPRHRFLEPIHNVKDRGETPLAASEPADLVSSSLENSAAARFAHGDGGAYRDRTDDLKLAKLALSQLS